MILQPTITCHKCQVRAAVRLELDLSRPIEPLSVECAGCRSPLEFSVARIGQLVEKRFATLQSKAEGQAGGTPREQVAEFVRLAHELVRKDEAFAAWKGWVDTNPGFNAALSDLKKLWDVGLGPAPQAPAPASAFEDALTGSLGMIPKPLEDELKRIRTQVENLSRAFSQARSAQEAEVSAVRAVVNSALCRPSKDGAALVPLRNVSAEVAKVVQHSAAALHSEFEARTQGIHERLDQARPVLDVDVDLVARRLVDHLAGSDEAREIFGRVADAYFAPMHRDLHQILHGLPSLLDALERPLETWEVGSHLTEGQAAAREEVLEVLRQIHKKVDQWMRAHRIEVVPDPETESPPFDEKWHTRMGTEPTGEASRHETVGRVIRTGYRWAHGRVRKAEVVVWDHAGDGWHDVHAPVPAAEEPGPDVATEVSPGAEEEPPRAFEEGVTPEPEPAVKAGEYAEADGQAHPNQTPPDSHEHL